MHSIIQPQESNEILTLAAKWMEMEIVILKNNNNPRKTKPYVLPQTCKFNSCSELGMVITKAGKGKKGEYREVTHQIAKQSWKIVTSSRVTQHSGVTRS